MTKERTKTTTTETAKIETVALRAPQGRTLSPLRLDVLSYNIHKGFSTLGTRLVLQKMRDMIRSTGADLVFLQEVIGDHTEHPKRFRDWPLEPQFEFLADSLWTHTAYGRNVVSSVGHHGNAIMSKHPITRWDNIDISSHPFENRGLLHAVITPEGTATEIHLICLHLALFEFGRTQQIQHLCARVNEHIPSEAPLIIAGDFNDWRHTAGRLLEKGLGVTECHKTKKGRYARTFPSAFPLLHLDRIYCRGLNTLTARALKDSPWSQLSDHLPLHCQLALPKDSDPEAEPEAPQDPQLPPGQGGHS